MSPLAEHWTVLVALAGAAVLTLVLVRRGVLDPAAFGRGVGGRPPGDGRDVFAIPLPVWLMATLVMFLAAPVGAMIAGGATGADGVSGTLREQALVVAGAYAAAIGAGAALLYLLGPRARPRTGLRLRLEDVLLGVIGLLVIAPFYFAVTIVSVLLHGWITGADIDPVAHRTLAQIVYERHNPWAWVVAAAVVLGGPIYEELLYRVFGQSTLVSLLGGGARTWAAILLGSAGFAAMHAIPVGGGPAMVPWHAVPGLFVLSVGLGIVYERAGKDGGGPLAPITAHALFNLLNIALGIAMFRD